MKFIFTIGLALACAVSGCVSKSKAKSEAQVAYLRGQNEVLMQQQQQKQALATPSVSFVGDVQNRVVAWHEDLSLSKAIVAAGYLGRTDPRVIAVVRQGQRHEIDPKGLLRGADDPLLEAGDVVEIRR